MTWWKKPKTDWAAGNVPAETDFNRIEGNILYLDEAINVMKSLIYTDGKLTQVNETVGGVLWRRTDLTYTGDDLTSVRVRVYASNGTTVISDYTDTLTYTSDSLTSVARKVV